MTDKMITKKGKFMDFKEFVENVIKNVTVSLGSRVKAEVRQVTKNNGVRLHGLILSQENASVSPTIYLDGFYGEYTRGKSMGDIVYEIVAIYENNKVAVDIDMDFFLDYQAVQGRIFLKVIHYEKNREMLKDVPFRRFLDLAVTCYYGYMSDFLGKGAIQIEIAHLDKWGISEEELFETARRNTMEKLGTEIMGMNEILTEILAEKAGAADEREVELMLKNMETEVPMYVMTLRGRYFGAACICYKEVLQAFGERCRKNFYILPSSVHELILVPDSGREEPEELQRMVREVNAGHVAPEERLSDQVYYFNCSENSLRIL